MTIHLRALRVTDTAAYQGALARRLELLPGHLLGPTLADVRRRPDTHALWPRVRVRALVSAANVRTSGVVKLMNPVLLASFAALTFLPVTALAQDAAATADPKVSCAQAFEQAQRLRNESKYVAANQEVLKCATPVCGEAIFQECTRIFTDLQAAIPSVVFVARDKNGNELADVSVAIDGQPTVERIDGKPFLIDPGSHVFRFTASGYLPTERLAVIRTGERFRPVSVVLERDAPAEAPQPATPVAAPPPALAVEAAPARPRSVPVASWVLGGVGVLAGTGALIFRVAGASDFSELQRDCSPNCSEGDIDKVKQKYLISNIAIGVGAAALAGAVTLYLVAPREAEPTMALQLGPTSDGVAARWSARF